MLPGVLQPLPSARLRAKIRPADLSLHVLERVECRKGSAAKRLDMDIQQWKILEEEKE